MAVGEITNPKYKSLKAGDIAAGNYFKVEPDGTFQCLGDGTAWGDLSGALMAAKLDLASGRLSNDYFNAGVSFHSNARYPEEPAVLPVQAKHSMVIGTGAVFRPHFHWLQQQAAIPNMLLGVKLTSYGVLTTFETDWSNYVFSIPYASVWTWASGVLPNITMFPEIDISGLTISGSIDVVLFRDSANASGLFAGADPVVTDVTIKYNDGHVKYDMIGSRGEIVK